MSMTRVKWTEMPGEFQFGQVLFEQVVGARVGSAHAVNS